MKTGNRRRLLPFIVIFYISLISSCMWPAIEFNNDRENLTVHFLDVGQGDCIFTLLPGGKTMLIDGGSKSCGEFVIDYIASKGVKKIDYLIATHPHEDHIGSIDDVIYSFEIGEIYMPEVITNTKVFEDLLTAAEKNGHEIKTASVGKNLFGYGSVKAEFIAPCGDRYEDLNNYSAVIKLTFGSVTFLFTGDAEEISEKEMLDAPKKIKADVLKVGHHGSAFSTHDGFLEAVSPLYAVISCGKNNSYGHPHEQILEKLKDVKLYRTDLDGTVIFITDGKNIRVETVSMQ